MTVLLIAIFAHSVGDFIFQTDKMAQEKSDMVKIAFLKHGFFVFIILFPMLLLRCEFKVMLLYSLVITILHIGVDYLICGIQNKYQQFQEWILFLIDQTIHLLIIFIGWDFLFNPKTVLIFNQISKNTYSEHMKIKILNIILIYGIIYLFFGIGSGYFISKLLKSTKLVNNNEGLTELLNNNEGLKKAGKLIGILERILIITLVINNSISAIGFVIAAKSIARYDKITTSKEFSEYYLIGTFASLLSGIIGGYTLIGMSRILT